MEDLGVTISSLGEIKLLKEVFLPDVNSTPREINDDCAHFSASGNMLWSIDPCPTPMASWFGKATPEVWGCYTAIINLSDIAASGGTPIGMLVSLEMPDTTTLDFVKGFQKGLMCALKKADTNLLGGNLKSASKFGATGTIIGKYHGNPVTRKITDKDCNVYIIGSSGKFWSAVLGNRYGWGSLSENIKIELDQALCYPTPQTDAGKVIGDLKFNVACMDCSDGAANALFQLAQLNKLDITTLEDVAWDLNTDIQKFILEKNIDLNNIYYSFGDWQLVCLVPVEHSIHFESQLNNFIVTKVATTKSGTGLVNTKKNETLNPASLNQNFSGGYNSITSIDDLITKFMHTPIFIPGSS